MNTALAQFLAEQAGRPFQLGESDCALWLADWVARSRCVPDPAAELRGRYATHRGWLKLAGDGGLLAIVDHCARNSGLARTEDPVPGDIGVVLLPNGHEAGAIMATKGWVVRCGKFAGVGVLSVPLKPLAAWRV